MKLKLLKIIFIIFILVGCKDEKVVNKLENENKLVDDLKCNINKQNLKIDQLNSYILSLEDEISEKKQELNDSIEIIEEMKQSIVMKDNELDRQKNSIDILNNKYGNIKSNIYEFINQYDNRLFIPEDTREGDDIKGMKIKKIIHQRDLWHVIKFVGATELIGEFSIIINDDYLGDMIFFYPNEATRTRLPHVFGDCRNDCFVISNYEEALDMLKDYKNEIVTIKIDEYLIDDLPSEVFNEAVLKEIY
ncbi:MAG: hypothetical protein N4A50_10485 [Vallitalea sp.]|jgi:uncharacterized coiled-coil protein SlyX|nr:hypothetical protein [Vallitalea sp.]